MYNRKLCKVSHTNKKNLKFRDEVCRNGDLLNSPALNYSLLDLSLSVNDMRERKMAEESISGNPEEDEVKTEDSTQEVYILI